YLPGATLALGKIYGPYLVTLQAGDCFAIVEMKDGRVVVSDNQVRLHDVEMNGRIEQIQREVAKELFDCALEDVSEDKRGGVRGKMWDRFCLELCDARREDVNNKQSRRGYGLLNGQSRLREMLQAQTFSLKEIATAIFVTDGLIPWSVMKSSNDQEIGVAIVKAYHEGGLTGLLIAARGEEKKMEATHYTNQAEATGVVLDFTK
ncbi:MAG: hypothetical protein Q8P97_00915, partial [bacterium]|nr:hypothetical protein [bacterium]